MFEENLQIIPIQTSDKKLVSDFIGSCPYYFRHLDWKLPVDWLGLQPNLMCQMDGHNTAIMICPYLHQKQVWMRCFAGKAIHSATLAWHRLFTACVEELQRYKVEEIYSLSLHDWYAALLASSGFKQKTRIIVMENNLETIPETEGLPDGFSLDRIQPLELPEIWELDRCCFNPLWQMSREDITTAYQVSQSCVNIKTKAGEIVGYQISSLLPGGGHLARIAVHPRYQGLGLGKVMLTNLLKDFERMGAEKVTVNTYEDNTGAISLYERYHFIQTSEQYPVFSFTL